MTQTVIKAGYRIHVTSWENDADNYRTKTMEGVAKEHLPFIVAACKLLTSKYDHQNGGGFGNIYQGSTEDLDLALSELIDKHPDRPQYCDDPEGVSECLLYKLGLMGGSEYTTRVFDSIKIEYIPENILIEDVTD